MTLGPLEWGLEKSINPYDFKKKYPLIKGGT